MNDLEYLHQISRQNRPAPKLTGLKAVLKSKGFRVIAVGTVLIIFTIVIGSMLGQIGARERDAMVRVHLRMRNLTENITKYNPQVKSPTLRAMGVSLSGTMSETSSRLYNVLVSEYNYSEGGGDPVLVGEELAHGMTADMTLERARMNGILDRGYLHQLIYEVELLLSLESEAMERTEKLGVQEILKNSMDNLQVIQKQLTSYKDTTN